MTNIFLRRRHLGGRYIEITATTKKNVNVEFEVNGCKSVDWGDGVQEKNPTPNATSTLMHEYTTDKVRTLKFYGDILHFSNKKNPSPTISSINFVGVNNISFLELSESKVSSVDLSSLKKLKYLSINKCRLTELDVSNNKLLINLLAAENRLTNIDITMLPNLERLSVYENKLGPTINIHNNTKLKYLWIQRMKTMKYIDISSNPNIISLAMIDSGYSGVIDLSNLYNVTHVQMYGCDGIEDVTFGEHPKIVKFEMSDSNIPNIDLTKLSNISYFGAWRCPNITDLDFSQIPDAIEISVYNCSLPTINLSSCTKLKKLQIQGNPLTDFILPSSLETLIIGYHENLNMGEVYFDSMSSLRRLDFGCPRDYIFLPFLVNKRAINPLRDFDSDFIIAKGYFIYEKEGQSIQNDTSAAVRFIASKVKGQSLYQYPQMFFLGRQLTIQETRDLYDEAKTIFYDTIILCGQESTVNLYPSSQFTVSFLSGQLFEYKESFTVKCKADAEFFIYPQSSGSIRFDKMSRVLYEKGVIKTKGGAKAVKKQTLPNNEIELEVTLEVTDKRNHWRIGFFENKYPSDSDPYKSKIIGVKRIQI